MSDTLILDIQGLDAGYGSLTILRDISLSVMSGETVCIIGRNGMGKTTLVSAIMGIAGQSSGRISFEGDDVSAQPIETRCRAGIGLVPQEREIFGPLTVTENLAVAARPGGDWSLDDCFSLFPRLAERRDHQGSNLSGGEQQMLSIARALMTSPRLLLLDEPSEGLAPTVVDEVYRGLTRIREESGLTILVVEQQVRRAMHFAGRTVALRNGRLVYDGSSSALLADTEEFDAILSLEVA